MLDIRASTVDELLANAGELFAAHRLEIARDLELMKLKPDEAVYRQLEKSGALMLLAAWQDGLIIGYSVNVVSRHPHYSDLITCTNDLLYVTPEYRHGRIGLRLIQATKAQALMYGARLMCWHAKPDTALEQILPRLGCRVHETVFSERLDV